MRIHTTIIIFLFTFAGSIAQVNDTKQAIKLYHEGYALFTVDEPTQVTDSMAMDKLMQAKNLFLKAGSSSPLIIDTYLIIGSIFQDMGEYSQALEHYRSTFPLRSKLISGVDSTLFKTYVLMGMAFYEMDSFDSARYYYNTAEKMIESYPYFDDVERLYNSMGVMFYNYGNYKQSINYYENAIATIGSNSPDKERIASYKSNIATALRNLNKYNEAITRYKEIINSKQLLPKTYKNLGRTYLDLQRYDSALYYLEKVIPGEDIRLRVRLNNDLGELYTHINQFPKALAYYQEAIRLNRETFKNRNTDLSQSYLGKGRIYEVQQEYKRALQAYQEALIAGHSSFDRSDIYQNPADFSGAVSPLHLFEVFSAKAVAFGKYYQQTKKLPDLEASLHTYDLAIRLAEYIQKSYDSDEAKLFFTTKVYPVYESAMATAFQLNQLTGEAAYVSLAFAFAEKSKAAVLTESLRALELKQLPGIPDSLLVQERDIKRKMTRLVLKRTEAKNAEEGIASQNQIRDLEIELARLQKRFEANEQYYQLKYNAESVELARIQESLTDPRTALVEYSLGQQHLYAFVITRNSFRAQQIQVTPGFRDALNRLREVLHAPEDGTEYSGSRWAHQLYQTLIAPLAAELSGKNRLVIVRDAELNFIPFEALETEASGKQYLLEKYAISYGYSASLLQQTDKRKLVSNAPVLAMAPFAATTSPVIAINGKEAYRNNSLQLLHASREEVERIGGTVLMTDSATKERFVSLARSHAILHLATHAQTNNEDPLNSYISFYPQQPDSASSYRLYTHELYNLPLDSVQLVVLSACETGDGQLVRGEGTMSLARAFAYAGCPSIITTLWKAADKPTANLNIRLHQYLKEGYPKDEALQRAKLDFLRSDINYLYESPKYWANIILVGEHSPVYPVPSVFARVAVGWWVGSALLLIGVAVLVFLRLYAQRERQFQ